MKSINVVALVLISGFSLFAKATPEAALADYLKAGNALLTHLEVLKDNAASCGFVGRMVAGRMADSMNQQRQQMSIVTSAVKRGSAGKADIQRQLQIVEDGNAELRSNTNMIRNGLSTNSPTCNKASAAFEKMSKLSLAQPSKFQALLSEL